MLRGLCPRLGFLPLLVDILIVSNAIETQTAKLHCGTIDCVVVRHDDGLLLAEDPPLKARGSAWSAGGPKCARREPASGRTNGGKRATRGIRRPHTSSERRHLGGGHGTSLSVGGRRN